MSEDYDVLETEKNSMTNETIDSDDDKAALVNDDLNVPSDAAVEDIDPDPITTEKMKRTDDQ